MLIRLHFHFSDFICTRTLHHLTLSCEEKYVAIKGRQIRDRALDVELGKTSLGSFPPHLSQCYVRCMYVPSVPKSWFA